ncbi:bifunctional hydroxymethylpyrimidine kinase/phosphomethylpyrimidine kinase [Alicyclobacillus tolerans]|uniref:Hydroxymethylpyrimidine/phosphomethylpyrimidine kinase n=1 Tax=Alicyclobacillus tolerans TaxID=90970 RepID=A0A1M6QQM2_9BACL|nr:bifunctional hydroxymethylpyrimidine kinase/phosphomethylpyrimidine kinase [Alicyclobacillus montanus]SHK22506.1 hydroxymethylpyrimidine/phosphomethylpyrimidine kinase [Alicyclobacillus montanus]
MYLNNGSVVRAMTIAGSDSGGGAGIQADLKTFAAFDVYGSSCITALTAQNTLDVLGIMEMTPEFVQLQLQSILDDIGTHALKTGMLSNENIIHVVAQTLQQYKITNIVVDPVMISKSGKSLLSYSAIQAMKEQLLPLADILTPNLPEAETLCGYPITTFEQCLQAAQDLASLGPRIVIIKGGHANEGDGPSSHVVDLVFDGENFTSFHSPRIPSHKTHGTGCTFSAAITAGLARGMNFLNAIASAKSFVQDAIEAATDWDVGNGYGPTNHSVAIRIAEGVVAGYSYIRKDGGWMRCEEISV